MMESESSILLQRFGTILARYSGNGTVRQRGSSTRCKFDAAQFTNGDIVVQYVPTDPTPVAVQHVMSTLGGDMDDLFIEGTTSDGWTFKAYDNPQWQSTDETIAVSFREFQLTSSKTSRATNAKYGITNFECVGPALQEVAPGHYVSAISLNLGVTGKSMPVTILPTPEARNKRSQTRKNKVPFVAAEIVLNSENGTAAEQERCVDDLCHILSVARGTYVNWIYRFEVDDAGEVISRHHYCRVSKQYSPLALFQVNQPTELHAFVQLAYPVFAERRESFQLTRGTIASYLEAKVDADYLETRCIKAAAAMEMLKATYLDRHPAEEWNVPPERLNEELRTGLREAMQGILKAAGLNSSERSDIASKYKIRDLNRRSFASVLKLLFGEIGLTVSEADLNLFTRCRNSLIHRGRFYCESVTDEDRRGVPPKSGPLDEYEFIIEVLDRTFLRLLGYSGSYTDWRGGQHMVNTPVNDAEGQ